MEEVLFRDHFLPALLRDDEAALHSLLRQCPTLLTHMFGDADDEKLNALGYMLSGLSYRKRPNFPKYIRAVLKLGASPVRFCWSEASKDGCTSGHAAIPPLLMALMNGHTGDTLLVLLRAGADPNANYYMTHNGLTRLTPTRCDTIYAWSVRKGCPEFEAALHRYRAEMTAICLLSLHRNRPGSLPNCLPRDIVMMLARIVCKLQ